MEAVLLDTDVFSFFFKKDSRRQEYEPHVQGRQPCLSFQSLAELKKWMLLRNWGSRKKERLASTLRRYVILPYDEDMTGKWAEVLAHRQRIGRPISCNDAWIAASALCYDLTLLTHNTGDFSNIPGLKVISRGAVGLSEG